MAAESLWRVAADAVLVVHASFVLFVVAGLALVLVGGVAGWGWVRGRAFRFAHLAAIAVVVGQSWLGVTCPLTSLEMALRARAGDATYAGAFVAHWVGEALYFSAPAWAFTAAYTAFGVAVAVSWFAVRPRRPGTRPGGPDRVDRGSSPRYPDWGKTILGRDSRSDEALRPERAEPRDR